MPFSVTQNNRLNCALSNPLFVADVDYLLEMASLCLDKIETPDSITEDIIRKMGASCFTILRIPTDDRYGTLNDETRYSRIFIGDLSEKFIDIMKIVQELWQFSQYLDSYPATELWDKGVKPKDKKRFLQILQIFHNKLSLLNFKPQKNRKQ